MKFLSILLTAFSFAFILASCNEDPNDIPCETGDPVPDCFCTMEYDPVCGCDNVTYSNACVAGCNGVPSSTPGACE